MTSNLCFEYWGSNEVGHKHLVGHCTVVHGIALYGGFGEVPNVGSKKCKKPEIFMPFEGLRHHLNVL